MRALMRNLIQRARNQRRYRAAVLSEPLKDSTPRGCGGRDTNDARRRPVQSAGSGPVDRAEMRHSSRRRFTSGVDAATGNITSARSTLRTQPGVT